MLTDKIGKSIDFGKKYKSSSVSQQHYNDLVQLSRVLKSNQSDIKNTLKAVGDAESIGLKSLFESEMLYAELEEIKNNLLDMDSSQVVTRLNNVDRLKNQIKATLEKVWRGYLEENFMASANVISSLSDVIENDDRLDKVIKLGGEITSESIGNKTTLAKIQRYKELSQAIIYDLKMNQEVEMVITKLSQNGELTLEDISAETMSWLSAHGVSKRIKLII